MVPGIGEVWLGTMGPRVAELTVLAVPGYKGHDQGLLPISAELSRFGISVVAINLPGMGISPASSRRLTFDDYVEIVRFVAQSDAIHPSPLCLMGHSFGCVIACHATAVMAGTAPKLVLLSPVVRNTGVADRSGLRGPRVRTASTALLRVAPDFVARTLLDSGISNGVTNAILSRRGREGYRQVRNGSRYGKRLTIDVTSVIDMLAFLTRYSCAQVAGDVGVDTLILGGDRDPFASVHDVTELISGFTSASSQIIGGAGHLMHLEDSGLVADQVRQFLNCSRLVDE